MCIRDSPGSVLTGPPLAVLLANILRVGSIRFQTAAANPLIGRESARLRAHIQALENGFQQTFLFSFGLVANSENSEIDLHALSICFAVARLAYWIGYVQRDPTWRVPGFFAGIGINGLLVWGALRKFGSTLLETDETDENHRWPMINVHTQR
eukprot:TRINITY_DN10025_c0_g1_i1.p1 TRINITY_DN10025_c0_g1~~TRINITY_DN10025_c0_g1_i1.p1  ORF type:complete len:153 (-),score=29.40 TRINITY_DN10025_c0_g1_i1:79-537(-)